VKLNISNNSNLDMDQMRPLLKSFVPFAQKKMGFDRPVSINFTSDSQNATNPLGKTAFYDPNSFAVTIYTDQRHPKDIMRSISHELVHHTQNCRGKFDKKPEMGEDYFQYNSYMRDMEREAYEKGNMCFRDWEEKYRNQLQESIYYKTGDTKMNHKDWKNQAIFGRLMESFGYEAPEEEESLEEGGAALRQGNEDRFRERHAEADRIHEEEELEEDEEVVEECGEAMPGEEGGVYLDETKEINEAKVRDIVRKTLKKVFNK